MSIPNEALRKVLLEIEQKSQFSSQQLSIVKSQLVTNQRETRMLQLTASEVGALPRETPIYEGVGKMFVQAPSQEVIDRLRSETEQHAKEKENLEKKMHYLEMTYKNSREHFERIVQGSGGSVG